MSKCYKCCHYRINRQTEESFCKKGRLSFKEMGDHDCNEFQRDYTWVFMGIAGVGVIGLIVLGKILNIF